MSFYIKRHAKLFQSSTNCIWRLPVRTIRGFQFRKPHTTGFKRYKPWKQWPKVDTDHFCSQYDALRLKPAPTVPYNKFVEESGVKIEDPNDPTFPVDRCAPPIEITHPAYKPPLKPEEHPMYKERPRMCITLADPLSESINHALVLSKAVRHNGLPSHMVAAVENFEIPNQHVQLSKSIMHSQEWDSTLQKMPVRYKPEKPWHVWPQYAGIPVYRKNEVLLNNLLRISCSAAPRFPGLRSRSSHKVLCYEANYERGDDLIGVFVVPHISVFSRAPINPIANVAEVDATANTPLADIFPCGPAVDLEKQHIYSDDVLCPSSSLNAEIHTVLLSQGHNYEFPWSHSQVAANAVLATFGVALAAAKVKYGEGPLDRLQQPIVVQGVQVWRNVLNFVVFQLNTLNFRDDNGIKNMVWIDKDNELFFLPDWWDHFLKVEEINVGAFQKFLAVILNDAKTY